MAQRTQAGGGPAPREDAQPLRPGELAGVDAADGPGAAGPEAPPVAALRRALEAALAATLPEQPAAVARLDQALQALPRSEAAARALLELLAGGRLQGLVERGGATSRAEAVRALLRLGYPWALEVDPADLAFLRAEEQGRAPRRGWRVVLLVALLGGAAGAYLLRQPAPRPPVTAPRPAPPVVRAPPAAPAVPAAPADPAPPR
jgi:hypothetical protein